MKNQLHWFKSLPFGLAARMTVMSIARKVTGLPITFSYAEGAEDILISYIARYHFGMTGPGRYVDVGCNAPIRYSNTFDLYINGWVGLNIDANQDLIYECRHVRKLDTSIREAVSDTEREVTFHKAVIDSVSTIDEEKLVEWKKHFEFLERDQETLITRTLTSILDEHWRHDRIDLLSIDVEGHDFQVLKSLDLSRYRPKIVVIETHEFSRLAESDVYRYLIDNGFVLKFFAVLNAYFVDAKSMTVQ